MKAKYAKLYCLISGAFCQASISSAQQRPFTVQDAVEMAYFGNIFNSSPEASYDDGAVSPDGRFALKITHRGILADGVTEGTIWLFDVADVIRSIEHEEATPSPPMPLVRMSAAINGYSTDFRNWGNILLHPRWSDDGQRVFFLGRDGQENRQLFSVDTGSQKVTALSPANRDVFAYAIAEQHVAFLAGRNIGANELWRSAGTGIEDIVVGTGTPLMPLLFPNFLEWANVEPLLLEVWRGYGESAEQVHNVASGNPLRIVSNFAGADISVSPDGKQAVAVIAESAEQGAVSSDGSYRIIDLESGEFRDSADPEAAGREWTPFAPRQPNDSRALRLEVAEGLNQPPVLVATRTETGESRTIFDPNPQLADIALLPVTVFEWEDQHGRTNIGGLIRPASFEAGRRYPLVIQTHGFDQNRFFRVGNSETANAGRALASRDMVVLQVQEPSTGEDRPINLEKAGLDVYLAAIDELAANGTVDPERVGITGYSFTGLTVATSISRAPERFAAAVIANADPLTMTGFYSYVDSPLQGLTESALVGTAPFDDGLRAWVDKSPTMSASSISAPVLISAADPMHLLSLWDLYSALRYQGKAVELQYIRSGKHNIMKPLHRVAHQEMIVDWFDFWLNGNEDADPEKVDQYRRWRELEQRVQ